MAAAMRSMLGRSRNRMSSVSNMGAMRDSDITILKINRNLDLGYSSRHPLESYIPAVFHPRNIRRPKPEPEYPPKMYGAGFFSLSSRDSVRVMINTHFALEEFNKQKAIDVDNVVRTYQAIVAEHFPSKPPDPQLLLFGLVADNGNGSLLKLIDNRRACIGGLVDNRYVERENIKLQRKKKDYLEDEILSSL